MKLISRFFFIFLLELTFCFSLNAAAQSGPTPDSAAPKKSREKTLNFEDELVEGSAQKPEIFFLFQKKNFNYKRLIKLRENFIPEMRKTSEDIQHTRSIH